MAMGVFVSPDSLPGVTGKNITLKTLRAKYRDEHIELEDALGRPVSENRLSRDELEEVIDSPHHYTPTDLHYDDYDRFMEETDGNADEEVRTGNNKHENQYTAAGHTQDAHYGICLWTGRIDKHTQERLSVVLEKPS